MCWTQHGSFFKKTKQKDFLVIILEFITGEGRLFYCLILLNQANNLNLTPLILAEKLMSP